MARASFETTGSLGWLGPPASSSDPSGRGVDVRQSDNWPIPLVVRREASAGLLGISADWFNLRPSESPLLPPRLSGEVEPYRVVSRKRLRLSHALFLVAFLALLALVAWEVNVYYGGDGLARVAAWLKAR